MKSTDAVVAFFVGAVLVGLVVRYLGVEGYAQKEIGMPVEMEKAAALSGSFSLLGSEPKPLSEKPYEMADDNKLFQFANNRMSADCCPSPFSGDRGCVCLTDADRALFASRGGNR